MNDVAQSLLVLLGCGKDGIAWGAPEELCEWEFILDNYLCLCTMPVYSVGSVEWRN